MGALAFQPGTNHCFFPCPWGTWLYLPWALLFPRIVFFGWHPLFLKLWSREEGPEPGDLCTPAVLCSQPSQCPVAAAASSHWLAGSSTLGPHWNVGKSNSKALLGICHLVGTWLSSYFLCYYFPLPLGPRHLLAFQREFLTILTGPQTHTPPYHFHFSSTVGL